MAFRGLVSILILLAAMAPVRPSGAASPGKAAGRPGAAESRRADPGPPKPSGGAPDIVLIVLDQVGFAGLGAFGGRVETPRLDRLSREGLRYAAFNVAATGAATRAALLTGRNPETLAVAQPAEGARVPGNGEIPATVPMLPNLLKPYGYVSFALGQWELVPPRAASAAAGRFEHWPTGRGFAHFYGWLSGSTDQWYPELYRDTTPVAPPRAPDQGYHATEDLVDNAIRYIDDLRSADPARPYFLYLALGAAGAPQQAPRHYRELYRGRFAQGWDRERDMVLERQEVLGILPPDTRLPARDPDVEAWAKLDPDRQALSQAFMENQAGFLTHADAQIGRLLDHLQAAGRLDNTLILVLSDGGAGGEGGRDGVLNRVAKLNGLRSTAGEMLARRDGIGDPATAPVSPWGWASLGNLPFRGGAGDLDNGGIRVPLIAYWTRGIAHPGSIRRQWLFVTDIVPTVLDLLQAPAPRGDAPPPHGASFLQTFVRADAPGARQTQYWDGDRRAVYHCGWKAVAAGTGPFDPFDPKSWRLYHLEKDFAEAEDLAAAEPGRLAEMVARFWAEAGRYGSFPPEPGRTAPPGPARETAPSGGRARQFVFHPGMSPLPEALAPDTFGRAYSVTAFLDRSGGPSDGVLAAQGGSTGGWAMFVQGGRPAFVYASPAGVPYTIRGADPLPAGRVKVRYKFAPSRNRGGRGELFVDDRKIGETRIEQPATATFGSEPFDVGRDSQSPVGSGYRPPFPYAGVIERVEVKIEE